MSTRIRVKEMRMVPADLLEPHPGNFRVHTDDQRAAMDGVLNEVGFAGAVLVREIEGGRYQVLDGHLRVEEMRGQQVPVLVTDLSEVEARKVLATFDAVGAMAEVDMGGLRALVDGLEWGSDAIERMLEETIGDAFSGTIPDSNTDPDDGTAISRAEELHLKWKTEPGQLWELGDHLLLCGDATREENVARLMGGKQADLLITDPPYGVSYASKNEFLNAISRGNCIQEPIVGDHGKPEDMARFWVSVFSTVRGFVAPGASYYITGPQGGDLLLLLQSLRQSNFPLRHMLIWAKNNHVLGRCDYHYKHEPIIFGWVDGAHRFYGGHSETSLWEIDKPHRSEFHPTQKPIELFERCMRNSSLGMDVILDPFSGSGTTILAAERLKRCARAMEIDPAYVAVALERWSTMTGGTPRLAGTEDA